MARIKRDETVQAEAIERLRAFVKPGDTVYTVLRSVSKSGMSREISLHTIKDGDITWIAGMVARALDYRVGTRDGIKVSGCGMDMGFHLVYNLSRALWPDGYGCTGEGCRSNDHSNGDRDYTPHHAKLPCTCLDNPGRTSIGNGAPIHKACDGRGYLIGPDHLHRDGGYALVQRWI